MMKFTAVNFSWSNGVDVGLQFGSYPAGAATVVAATNALDAFLIAAYGANALMTASQIVASYETILGRIVEADQLHGTEDADLIHGGGGDDTIYGSDGGDLIDGAEGRDVVDYSLVDWGNRFILKGDVQSSAGYVGSVVSTGLFPNDATALFGVEEIRAGDTDDEVQLMGLPASLERIDGGDQGELGDLLSAFYASQGISFHMEGGLLAIGEATLEAVGFERVEGSGHNDVISGNDQSNAIKGGYGSDSLFGGGADDFIFFDAEDSHVYGGTGRDVAVALGDTGVTVDMAAQGLECVIGCAGADTFILQAGESTVFAAGGNANDTFTVRFADTEAPKILWGGPGADTFNFEHSTAYENWWDYPQLGLAVVTIAGLTEEMFASLTLDDLGLGDMDLSLIDAIVINPDAGDQYLFNGGAFQTSGWDQMYDPQNFGVAFGVKSSTYLGGSHAIQSLFGIDVFQFNEFSMNFEYFDIIVSGDETVDTRVVAAEWSDGLFWSPWDQAYMPITPQHPLIQQAIAQTEAEAAAWFAENGYEYQTHWASDAPNALCSFFVVGGRLAGSDLISNNSLVGALPEDAGPTPFDWLLAA